MTSGNKRVCAALVPVLAMSLATAAFATGPGVNSVGPDVTVLYLASQGGSDINEFGPVSGMRAYSFGTTSCNRGTQTLEWYDSNGGGSPGANHHPVIAQQMYRLHDGVFEQIGSAWLKHGFCAVNEPGCGTCQSTNCDTLGLGCADTYWAGLNENGLKPRSPVNASTGVFPFPEPQNPTGSSTIAGRLQVPSTKMGVSSAQYFIEGLYIASDDHANRNDWNNASWREVNGSNPSSLNSIGATVECEPAIFAWSDNDPTVKVSSKDVDQDGWVYVANSVKEVIPGELWRYDYVLQNVNSHRSLRSFTIPIGDNVTMSNQYFRRSYYHSGEVSGTNGGNDDWTASMSGGDFTCAGDTYTAGTDQTANALRWGHSFSFGFMADSGPDFVSAEVDMFRPGTPATISFNGVRAPEALGGGCPKPGSGGACPACDLDESGVTNGLDIAIITSSANFGLGVGAAAEPCADVNGSGTVEGLDVSTCTSSACFGL